MTKQVTRYELAEEFGRQYMDAAVSGEWVKYEDIKHLLQDEPKADPAVARARANFNLSHGINEGAWDRQKDAEKSVWIDAARRQLDAENR